METAKPALQEETSVKTGLARAEISASNWTLRRSSSVTRAHSEPSVKAESTASTLMNALQIGPAIRMSGAQIYLLGSVASLVHPAITAFMPRESEQKPLIKTSNDKSAKTLTSAAKVLQDVESTHNA